MPVAHTWYDGQLLDCLPDTKEAMFDASAVTFVMLQRIATLCNHAELNQEDLAAGKHLFDVRTTGDASESALVKFCQKLRDVRAYRAAYPEIFSVPFNSTNKFQLAVHSQGAEDRRLLLMMKGAPERIIQRCSQILVKGQPEPLTDEWRAHFQHAYDEMGGQGERVLGFAYLPLDPEQYPETFPFKENPRVADNQSTFNFPAENLIFVGLFSLIDPPRESVPMAVEKCRTSGVKVIMVTGDHPLTAKAIARKIGLITEDTVEDIAKKESVPVESIDPKRAKAIVITGAQLPGLTEQQWDDILSHPQIVFARTSPQQKYIIVENNQRRGEIVAVTGDGVNDSPALKKAHIGVAMGISGSDVSKDAAKMILLDDNFASIVAGIEEGRLIYDNLKKSIAYTLSSNVSECAPFLAFLILGVPLPISTILILCIDLGADMFSAISLAYEKPEADLMLRPPRDMKQDSLLTLRMVSYSYPQMGMLASLTGFFIYAIYMHHRGYSGSGMTGLWKIWGEESVIMRGHGFASRFNVLSTAQTCYFAGVMMGKLAILLSCKTRKLSLFQQSWRNHVLNVAVVLQILVTLLIIYVPPFHIIFGSRDIKFFFLASLPWFLFVITYDEIRKWLMRRSPGGWVERNTYW
jgi:sodium/potassium-transporting ATPase subunit alpha